MSRPSTATRSVEIAAPPGAVYDLISDVTRMGEWSPECRSCEWLDAPGAVGSRFKGHNKRGFVRWTTVARVTGAEPGRTFGFTTLNGDQDGTRWSYRLDDLGGGHTKLSESFEAVSEPRFVALMEKLFVRHRQQQLESGIDRTLAAIKAAAEQPAG